MSQALVETDQVFLTVPEVEVEQVELNGQTLTLPVLAEGHFWRLAYAGLGMTTIQLRKKFGPISLKVDERHIALREDGRYFNPASTIEKTAAGMMRTRLVENEQERIFDGLYGDFKQVK